jgi:hypothetical protein
VVDLVEIQELTTLQVIYLAESEEQAVLMLQVMSMLTEELEASVGSVQLKAVTVQQEQQA